MQLGCPDGNGPGCFAFSPLSSGEPLLGKITGAWGSYSKCERGVYSRAPLAGYTVPPSTPDVGNLVSVPVFVLLVDLVLAPAESLDLYSTVFWGLAYR